MAKSQNMSLRLVLTDLVKPKKRKRVAKEIDQFGDKTDQPQSKTMKVVVNEHISPKKEKEVYKKENLGTIDEEKPTTENKDVNVTQSCPLCKVDHVTVTRDLPSLRNADIKGSEFITNDKLLIKVDSKMMDFVGAKTFWIPLRFSSIGMLLLFTIGELEEKKKALELEDNMLKEKDLADKEASKLQVQLADQKKETEKTSVKHVLQLQQAFMMGHEGGFQKAICQIAFFAPEIDVNKFDVLKDAKDGELVREFEIGSYEEASNSETTSKAGDAEVTSNFALTSNPPTT
ncbi:hypothetical protein GYH30_052251 [Glycine max]|nr:hypothetical protein GYH30_052251 [Glycine max]